jgi:hypothetical protein
MYDPAYDDTEHLTSFPINTHNRRVPVPISIKYNVNGEWYCIYANTQALTSDSVPAVPVTVTLEDLIDGPELVVINSPDFFLNNTQPYKKFSPYPCDPSPSFFSDCIATDTTNLQSEPDLGSPNCYGVFSYEGEPLSENCGSEINDVDVLLPGKSMINSKRKENSGDSIYEHGIESPTKTKKSKHNNTIIDEKQCKKKNCEHGTNKYRCRICGGSAICVHGNERYRCKQCGGSSICEHNKQRTRCRECGGASICEHNKQRPRCKECGGASICVHKRRRTTCKECGGDSVCVHGRQRSQCKVCKSA